MAHTRREYMLNVKRTHHCLYTLMWVYVLCVCTHLCIVSYIYMKLSVTGVKEKVNSCIPKCDLFFSM